MENETSDQLQAEMTAAAACVDALAGVNRVALIQAITLVAAADRGEAGITEPEIAALDRWADKVMNQVYLLQLLLRGHIAFIEVSDNGDVLFSATEKGREAAKAPPRST